MRTPVDEQQRVTWTPRSVLVLSGIDERDELMDAFTADPTCPDVVFMESIDHGYSRAKEAAFDAIVVCAGIDDAAACQLLSMLTIDCETRRIPVAMWVTR